MCPPQLKPAYAVIFMFFNFFIPFLKEVHLRHDGFDDKSVRRKKNSS